LRFLHKYLAYTKVKAGIYLGNLPQGFYIFPTHNVLLVAEQLNSWAVAKTHACQNLTLMFI